MAPLTQVGILHKVEPAKYVGKEKNLQIRDFWLEVPADDSQYDSQFISFQLMKDRCDLIADFNIGDEIEVYFNLRGRKWTGSDGVEKCFNSLNAWRLSAQTQEGQDGTQEQQNNGLNDNQKNPQHGVIELNLGQNSPPSQNNNPQRAQAPESAYEQREQDPYDDVPF